MSPLDIFRFVEIAAIGISTGFILAVAYHFKRGKDWYLTALAFSYGAYALAAMTELEYAIELEQHHVSWRTVLVTGATVLGVVAAVFSYLRLRAES